MSMLIVNNPEPYSDFVSLKKYVEANYGTNAVNMFECFRAQTGTAGAVELEEKAGQTIAHIGKTELTLVLACDTNDNAYDGESVTIHYLDADGVSHEASAAYDTTDTTTEVAFTDAATGLVAVTDFYCFDPAYGALAAVSSCAVETGDNVCIGSTGCVAGIADPETCVAIIEAADTSPDLDNMHGVGNLWGKTEANHNDGDGMILTIEYLTPWGTVVEGATCTINTTDGQTEVRFVKSSGIYVQDYYRTRKMTINKTPTSNTHAVFATTYNGDAIYAAIEEGYYESVHSRYMVPASTVGRAWLARIKGTNGTAAVSLAITLTPKDKHAVTITKTIPYPYMFDLPTPVPIELEPLSEISFTILGNTAVFETQITIIEAEV